MSDRNEGSDAPREPEENDASEGSPEDPAEEVGVFDADIVEEESPTVDDEEETSPEVAGLTADLQEAERERDEYLDSLRRLKAEFENSRKRQERERERILQTASERLILSLLPVLDNLDRALDSDGDVREGVRATREQLAGAMADEGLLLVESDGEHFDPNFHEAVMSQPSEEHEEGTVIQTFERGYVLNGKPIRPAKVIVSQ